MIGDMIRDVAVVEGCNGLVHALCFNVEIRVCSNRPAVITAGWRHRPIKLRDSISAILPFQGGGTGHESYVIACEQNFNSCPDRVVSHLGLADISRVGSDIDSNGVTHDPGIHRRRVVFVCSRPFVTTSGLKLIDTHDCTVAFYFICSLMATAGPQKRGWLSE